MAKNEVKTIGVKKEELVKLRAPENVSAISVRGMEFEVPAEGIVECPPDVAGELKSHGFTEYVAPRERVATK